MDMVYSDFQTELDINVHGQTGYQLVELLFQREEKLNKLILITLNNNYPLFNIENNKMGKNAPVAEQPKKR